MIYHDNSDLSAISIISNFYFVLNNKVLNNKEDSILTKIHSHFLDIGVFTRLQCLSEHAFLLLCITPSPNLDLQKKCKMWTVRYLKRGVNKVLTLTCE